MFSRTSYHNWQTRKEDYEKLGLTNNLITTGDLDGINEENIQL